MSASPDTLYTLIKGRTPLLISVPHAGSFIPADIRETLTPIAQTVPDTDWHVGLLYECALELGASLMVATHSRYVVDLNRDPHNAALYPGADNTELCPTRTFDQAAIYLPDRQPDAARIALRRERYWAPYHAELQVQLAAIKAEHGRAVLLDGHSIRSRVPRFFEGRLPDLNLGTSDGRSCAPALEADVMRLFGGQRNFSSILNGRFKGGYITRHYGRPGQDMHALQLEMAQCIYMDEEAPYAWDPVRAQPLRVLLRSLVELLLRSV